MGLPVSIYKDHGTSCAGPHGVSTSHDRAVLVNVSGPFEPRDDAPALMLAEGPMTGQVVAYPAVLVDDEWVIDRPDGHVGPMMGGCYVATSDSRFGEAVAALGGPRFGGAVALHDRFETPAQYAALST